MKGAKGALVLLVLQSPSGALDGPNVVVRIPPRAGLFLVKISAQKEGVSSWDLLGRGCV